jgi:rSAM/selenodomain-associated transferase 1
MGPGGAARRGTGPASVGLSRGRALAPALVRPSPGHAARSRRPPRGPLAPALRAGDSGAVPAAPRLVLFARYPRPGACKTRLIPALGPEGAAALHRRLAEQTLAVLRAAGAPVEVRATGADPAAFRAWLGAGPAIIDQGSGDLGERLARASPPEPVLFFGSDAPDLGLGHVRAAIAALERAAVVIGPAEDGGYWCLGLARPAPWLFAAMPWGTDALLAATLAACAARGVTPALLAPLADCDRPEDLARWPALRPGSPVAERRPRKGAGMA